MPITDYTHRQHCKFRIVFDKGNVSGRLAYPMKKKLMKNQNKIYYFWIKNRCCNLLYKLMLISYNYNTYNMNQSSFLRNALFCSALRRPAQHYVVLLSTTSSCSALRRPAQHYVVLLSATSSCSALRRPAQQYESIETSRY